MTSIDYIIINFYIFFSLKSKFSSIYNCRMESMKVMLWKNLAEIEGQLLEDMKEEILIVILSNVLGNIYIKVINVFLKLYLLLIKTCSNIE